MGGHLETNDDRETRYNRERNETVSVILDAGTTASVLGFPGDADLALGTSFTHDGMTWMIVSYRDHARAFVAVPLRQNLHAKRHSHAEAKSHQPAPLCCPPPTL